MHPQARITLRPIANPLPLGFLALSAATLLISGLQLEWLEPAEGHQVALILLAFVVPLQLVAAVFGYLGRDVVAGTGMGLLTGTWGSVGLVLLTAKPGSTSDALGLLLLMAAVAMLVPASAALTGKVVPALVLLTTSVRFALTGLAQITAGTGWQHAAGIVGLLLCGLAVYAAFGLALEDAGVTVLPLGRHGRGRAAIEGDLSAQTAGLEHEAGVRQQL